MLLSERVMRALILRVEHLTEEDILKQATAAVHAPAAPVAAEDTVAQNEPEAAGTEVADNPEPQV